MVSDAENFKDTSMTRRWKTRSQPIADKCDEAIKWLDANKLAEVKEFTDK